MQKVTQVFSETFKRGIVERVNSGLLSKEEARRSYGIKGKSSILLWQRNYEKYGRCSLNLPTDNLLPSMPKKSSQPGTAEKELQDRIKELERRLEDEQLRSEPLVGSLILLRKSLIFLLEKSPIPSNP